MGISIDASRIVCTDGAGNVRLDTNEGLFVATNYLTGTKTLSQHVARNLNNSDIVTIDFEQVHTLVACHASATTVRGAFKVTTSDNSGLAQFAGWYNAGGSYVHIFQGGGTLNYNGNVAPTAIAVYSFFIESGQVKLRERVRAKAEYSNNTGFNDNYLTIVAPTFEYRLLCGLYV